MRGGSQQSSETPLAEPSLGVPQWQLSYREGDYTSTVSGLVNGLFLSLCALWTNLVGDDDVGRNAEWDARGLTPPFTHSQVILEKRRQKLLAFFPPNSWGDISSPTSSEKPSGTHPPGMLT